MVQSQSSTQAVRAVFVIDPNAVVRTILFYPASSGRDFDEIKRVVLALQKADKEQIAIPANWRPGQDVIIPTPGSCGTAKEHMEIGALPVFGEYRCFLYVTCRKLHPWCRLAHTHGIQGTRS